eukprot:GHVT01098167.1.p3 GENE.GHVT01098167.1~~GHVT01098167.1.p3  ORF type:complete len:125 (+),score=35.46 GHVT01098167.1:381-755(+)
MAFNVAESSSSLPAALKVASVTATTSLAKARMQAAKIEQQHRAAVEAEAEELAKAEAAAAAAAEAAENPEGEGAVAAPVAAPAAPAKWVPKSLNRNKLQSSVKLNLADDPDLLTAMQMPQVSWD